MMFQRQSPEYYQNEDLGWLLHAYRLGVFPMADSVEDEQLFWCDPPRRGVIFMNEFHVPRRLQNLWARNDFQITVNKEFSRVVELCAAPAPDRPSTWISQEIFDMYCGLHAQKYAHSVEVYLKGELVGGIYGVAIGRIFFGESMFSRVDNASKIALCSLMARLWAQDFTILDTQFVTKHLQQFGAREISRNEYRRQLQQAIAIEDYQFSADFPYSAGGSLLSSESELVSLFLQSRTQTS